MRTKLGMFWLPFWTTGPFGSIQVEPFRPKYVATFRTSLTLKQRGVHPSPSPTDKAT